MLTINSIFKKMKDVPVNRLEELYQFINSLTPATKRSQTTRNKILSYGGAFSDMSEKDYADYLHQTKKTRTKLFDRNFDL